MDLRINRETANDPYPVEQEVSIRVGEELFAFKVIVPRYIAGKLTQEDWIDAATKLKREKDRHIYNSVVAGDYFSVAGFERVCDNVRRSMCDLIYERFKEYQIRAGNEAWEVPATLQGAC